MDIELIAEAERCEMCGAVKCGREVDIRESWTMAEAMRRLTDIWLQDPVALGVILCRVAMPDSTYREIGSTLGKDVSTIVYHIREIKRAFPELGAFVGATCAHARAEERKRRCK